ncbi:MAG: hypothetical protein OER86_00320 [Phycisphaerae bacterium]|nr:hypothetical protein [Phycisphaerae bacterium]
MSSVPHIDGLSQEHLLDLRALSPGTHVAAETRNSVYEFLLLDPKSGAAFVTGGRRFEEPTEVVVRGSTWGGSMLLQGRLGLGMHMEIGRLHGQLPFLTSRVQRISAVEPIGDRPRSTV